MPPALETKIRPATRSLIRQYTKPFFGEYSFPRRSIHQTLATKSSDKPKDGGSPNSSFPSDGPFAIGAEEFKRFIEQHRVGTGGPSQPPPTEQDQASPDAPQGEEPHADHSKTVFHGSAVRRRQRVRSMRADKPQQSHVPQWFLDRNVQLRDDFSRYYKRQKFVHHKLKDTSRPNVIDDASDYCIFDYQPRRPKDEGKSTESLETKEEGRALSTARGEGDNEPHDALAPINRSVKESKDARYGIDLAMNKEIIISLRGLLRPPINPRTYSPTSNVQNSHLIIQYPSDDAEIFLDKTVGVAANQLYCDLLVLDAQDIAELILNADLGEDVSNEATALSFEVYSPRNVNKQSESDVEDVDEGENGQDFIGRGNNSFGTPVLVGQPIRINLSDLMHHERHSLSKSSWRPSRPPSFMSALLGEEPSKSSSGAGRHIFSKLVTSILSAPGAKREDGKATPKDLPSESSLIGRTVDGSMTPEIKEATEKGILIHIQAIKLIQETAIGRQFLSELFEQVQRRRAGGERIIVVGTEASSELQSSFPERMEENLTTEEFNEPSTTILLTPTRSLRAEKEMLYDRRLRFAAINYRHLDGMLRAKWRNPSCSWLDYRKEDFLEHIETELGIRATSHIWAAAFVHRIACIIWGRLETRPHEKPSIYPAFWILGSTDKSRIDWASNVTRSSKLASSTKTNGRMTEDAPINKVVPGLNKYEKALYSGVIEPSKIKVTFDDIHAPIQTIEAVQTLTTLSLIRPEAFQYGVLASDRLPGLMLYGPPGTGKTLIAKAVAKESGATVLAVSSAQLNNMYVGEGEKNVRALFSLAKKLSPCVVFLDEADSMFSSRSSGGKRVSHRELLNQFLTEWDGMSNDAGGAFIMVATNRPMDLDDAVLRRLPRRILIDLPTEMDRLEILKIHLRNEQLADDVDLADLAKRTPFYSGSDLKNTAVAAALECVREENEMAKKHVGDQPFEYDEKRTLKAKHFEKALDEISASISEDMGSLRDIKKFDEQYGDKRGKKRKSGRWGFSNATEADKMTDTIKVRS